MPPWSSPRPHLHISFRLVSGSFLTFVMFKLLAIYFYLFSPLSFCLVCEGIAAYFDQLSLQFLISYLRIRSGGF